MSTLKRIIRYLPLCGLLAVVLLTPPLHAQLTHVVYDDALTNEWQDWGWASQINYNESTTVHGGSRAVAVTAHAWEAAQIGRGSVFDTTGYDKLRFWVHGGTGGQMLSVAVSLDYTAQPGVGIGPLPAGTWELVEIPLVSLGADNRTNVTQFWIQNATGSPAPTFYLDEIAFVGADQPTTPPPPLNGGMAIYQDALVNGWQNWSWETTVGSTSGTVHTGASAMAVTTRAWGGLSLYHPPLDTTNYPTLTFWINGGPVGGQTLRLLVELSGVAQPGIALPPLAADTWQKIVVPLADLNAANRPDLTRITLQNVSGVTLPTYYLDDARLDLAPPPSVVNVQVDSKDVLRTVDPRMFGINTAVWDGFFHSATTAELLLELDNQALRFPGGSLSDEYHWKTNTTLDNPWEWATSFDEFAEIATTTGAEVFITVNYGTGTPEEAAEWVRYSNVTKRYGFTYWEVGNENYGQWESDVNQRPHDPVTYATRFQQYMTLMKAEDPTIKVGAVITASEDDFAHYTDQTVINPRTSASHNGWTSVLLATFKQLGVVPDFVAYHRYEQASGQESDAYLLQSSKGWSDDAASIRQMLTDYLGAAGARVEINSTEGNSVSSGPGKQTTSLVNGLFLADSLGNILKTEFNSHFWWDFRNGTETGNNNSPLLYGWRQYGDYGIVNNADPAGPADRYPTFYVYKLLQHFARGGELVLPAESDYNLLGAYAVRDRNKTLHLLLINKHPTEVLNASVVISGFNANPRGEIYTYGIAQDEAARTGEGSADLTHTTATLGGKTFVYQLAPYSATVIRIKGNQGRNETAPNQK